MRYLFLVFTWCFTLTFSFAQDEKLAQEYYNQGKFELAAPIYEKLYTRYAYGETYFRKLQDCYRQAGDKAALESLLQKQAKRFDEDVWYKVEYGVLLEAAGDAKAARKQYDEALKKLPAFPDKVKKTAAAFQQAGKNDYALACFEKGESFSGKGYYAFEKADIQMRLQEYNTASKTLLSALKADVTLLSSLKTALSTWLEDDPQGPFQTAFRTELLREIQADPNAAVLSELLMWQYIQQRNYEAAFIQAKALDKRSRGFGEEVYKLGRIAAENEQFDLAVRCFEYVVDKGPEYLLYPAARTDLVRTMHAKFAKGYSADPADIQKLDNLYQSAINEMGISNNTASIVIDYADLCCFYQNNPDKAIGLLQQVLQSNGITPRLKADAKLKLADVLVFTGDMWEPALLYGQVEKEFKNDIPAQEAKFRNARLAYFREEFEYAQGQMKVLKASTSKLFSNDAMWLSHLITDNLGRDSIRAPLQFFSKADLKFYQNQNREALEILDTLLYFYPSHHIGDEVYFRKAQILMKMGKYAEAYAQLDLLIQKFPSEVLIDDALFMAADIQEFQLKNTQLAMQLYERILLEHKDSLFVAEARKRYRQLRGDVLN